MAYLTPIRRAGAPTVNDDASKGYLRGQVWVNTTTSFAYVNVDAAVGAAVWASIATGSVSLTTLPLGSVFWSANAVATAIATMNAWTRVAPVAGPLSASTIGFDKPANARLRFTQTASGLLVLSVTLSFSSAAPNDIYEFGVWKNGGVNVNNEFTSGAQVAGSTITLKAGGAGDALSSAVSCLDAPVTNDYYELAVRNTSAASACTIKDANLVGNGHPT